MSRTAAKFTELDVKRLLKAGRSIDPELTVCVLPDGSLLLVKGVEASPEKPLDARPEYRF